MDRAEKSAAVATVSATAPLRWGMQRKRMARGVKPGPGEPMHDSMDKLRCLPLVLILGLLALPVAAEVTLYKPAHRTAEELAPLLEPAFSQDGFAMVDRHSGQLVLHGPKADISRARELLELLDLPQLSYNVEFQVVSESECMAQGIELSGRLPLGELGVLSGRRSSQPGLELRAGSARLSENGKFRTTLLVQDGTPAQLWTGSVISPRRGGWLAEQDNRSGMRVETRTLRDGRVHLSLYPVRSRGGRAEPLSAVTKLALEAGNWVALGELGTRRDSADAALTGAGRSAGAETQRLLVRALPLSLPASAPRPSAAE